MGNGNGTSSTSYLWIIPVALIVISAVAIIGVAFYLVFPELRYIRGSCNPQKAEPAPAQAKTHEAATPVSATVSNSCEVLLKTMTPEEQKVLNVLMNH